MNTTQFWNGTIARHENKAQPVLLVGLVLVVVLSSLISFNPLIGVAAALLFLLLLVTVPRPILIVYGLILVLPLTAGIARGAGVPFLRLGQALLVVGAILFVLSRPARLGKGRLTIIDLAFVLLFLCEAVFPVLAIYYSGGQLNLNSADYFNTGTPLQSLLGPLQYYLLYRIVVATISSEKQILVMLKLIFAASIIVSIIGILQKLGVGPVTSLINTYYPTLLVGDTSPTALELRITSTLGGYRALSAYLCFTLIVALACYTVEKRPKISPLLLVATFLSGSIALLLTGTFAGYVGLIIGAIIVFTLFRRMPKWVFFVLAGIVLGLLIFQPFIEGRFTDWLGGGPGQDFLPTFADRVRLWRELFLPAIAQNIWFGAGPAPAVLNNWPTEETQYLYLLLRGGLPYFFSYFLLMGVSIAICWRQIKHSGKSINRIVAVSTLAILIALNIMNVSGAFFTNAGCTELICILLAIIVTGEQLQMLEAASDTPVVDGRWQVVRLPFSSPASSAVSIAEEGSTIEIPALRSNDIPARRNGAYRRFTSLVRIPDWRFVKDSAIVGAGSTFARVLGLLFWIVLAHFLTPDDVGFVRYSIALVGIIAIMATASPVSLSRFLAANQGDQQARDRYFSNGLLGIVLLTAASLLVSLPVLWLLHAFNIGTILCIVGMIGFYFYFAIARGVNSAWKMGLAYLLSNTAQIVVLVVVLAFFQLHTATIALSIYGLTFLTPIIVELIRPVALHFRLSLLSKRTMLELARFALPVVASSAAYTIWFGIDILLVENFVPHEAGSYTAAKTLAGAFIFIPTAITLILMPRAANLNLQKSKRDTAGAVLATVVLCLCGLAIVAMGGSELIALSFGQRYSTAYLPLLMLCVGMSFYSIYIILEAFIIGRGRPAFAVIALITALVSTAVTGPWLISRMGMLGASLSFTIGAALSAVMMAIFTWLFFRSEQQLASKDYGAQRTLTA